MRRFDLLAADAFAYEWPRRDPPSSLRRPGSPSLCSMVDHLTSLLYVLLPWNWKTESEDSQHLRRLPRSADILRLEQVRGNRRQNRVRTRLFAGAKGVRTLGPAGGGELSSRVLHGAALGRVPPTPGAVAPSQVYVGGGTKPPISAASTRANAIVVGSSPSGPMIYRPTGNPSAVKPIGAAVAGR